MTKYTDFAHYDVRLFFSTICSQGPFLIQSESTLLCTSTIKSVFNSFLLQYINSEDGKKGVIMKTV